LARFAEHAGEVEVGVGIVGLHFQSPAVPADGASKVAQVLVERAQVEGGLAAGVVGVESGPIAGLGPLVASHAVLEESQIVPGRGVAGVDFDHALVGFHGRFPALRIAVPRRRAREPDLGGVGGRDEGPDHAHEEGLARLSLEGDAVEIQERLPGARIEAQAILLDHDALVLHDQPHLGEGRLRPRSQAPRAVQGLAYLAHRRSPVEQCGGDPRGHELPEAIPGRVAPHESQALELGGPLGREPQEPRQLPECKYPFGLSH